MKLLRAIRDITGSSLQTAHNYIKDNEPFVSGDILPSSYDSINDIFSLEPYQTYNDAKTAFNKIEASEKKSFEILSSGCYYKQYIYLNDQWIEVKNKLIPSYATNAEVEELFDEE